jgi:hypothetical protein
MTTAPPGRIRSGVAAYLTYGDGDSSNRPKSFFA